MWHAGGLSARRILSGRKLFGFVGQRNPAERVSFDRQGVIFRIDRNDREQDIKIDAESDEAISRLGLKTELPAD